MGISKRMLIGTAITGAIYFLVGEFLYRTLLNKIPTPLLVGLYFLGLMVFVLIGINIIGTTMPRSSKGYKDIVLRCLALCVAMLAAGALLELVYEVCFRERVNTPSSYVFALDNSGSMTSNDPENQRYDAIQATLENKKPDFQFAVYTFANSPDLIRPMGPVSDGTEFDLEEPNGGTGIKTIMETMYEDIDSGALNLGKNGKILLFTDGYATDMKPIIGKASLNRVLEKFSNKGISISTVGLGDPDDELMDMIAKKTNGVYVRVEEADLLEEAMKEAIDSNSDRNLLDYRSKVSFDFLFTLIRFVAVLLLGLLLGLLKMYVCEPFLDTRPLWLTSVICSLIAAACVEFGMNKFGLLPQLMRFFMCVLLAMGTLKTKADYNNDYNDIYKHY